MKTNSHKKFTVKRKEKVSARFIRGIADDMYKKVLLKAKENKLTVGEILNQLIKECL